MKAIAAVLVLVLAAWLVVVNHIGAPADPAGPCPAGSHVVTEWVRGNPYADAPYGTQMAGVKHWLGYTETATCGASISVGAG